MILNLGGGGTEGGLGRGSYLLFIVVREAKVIYKGMQKFWALGGFEFLDCVKDLFCQISN